MSQFSTHRSPRFSPVLARGFELIFDRVQSLLLTEVHWRTPSGLTQRIPSDRPVLLFGNHVSNWDGFLYRALQKKLRTGVPIYSLMLERELQRLPLFRALGGVGIDPASAASVARAVRAAQALRTERSDFFFSVFPQGSTFPAGKRPLGFQEGVRHFARALGPVTLLPVALQFEWLGSLRPHVWITVGEPLPETSAKANGEVPALEIFEASVTELLDRTNAELCARGESAKGNGYGNGQSNGVGEFRT
jgi:1-acyl-sn-glycerol-3-phosphate acyltransferase